MELTGIIDAQEFRNSILAKRDTLKERGQHSATSDAGNAQLLALNTIITKLDEIIAIQKTRTSQNEK
ncbi:MAG: hypothetical protein HC782_03835 [Gammaproteobacteria bacterium]|nr:hypothetical protein [Gammaproteobacteria bacterium]